MLLEGKWQLKRCCCCSVEVGTTIIGVLDIIGYAINLLAVSTLPNDGDTAEYSPMMGSLRRTVQITLNPTTKAILGIIDVISIIVAALLLYGNFNAKTKFMTPKVYWSLANLVVSLILVIVSVSGELKGGKSSVVIVVAVGVFVAYLIGLVLSLWLIQVVRSRIADIEDSKRPKIPFNQGEIPFAQREIPFAQQEFQPN